VAVTGKQALAGEVSELQSSKIFYDESAAPASAKVLLENFLNESKDLVYFKDRQSRYIYTNNNVVKYFNLADLSQLAGKTDYEILPGEWARETSEGERQIMESGQPDLDRIVSRTGPDGMPRRFSISRWPLLDDRGAIIGTWGIERDITQVQSARETLETNEARHLAMIENISDVISVMELDGTIRYISPNVEKNFGWQPAEIVGLNWETLIHPGDQELISQFLDNFKNIDGAAKTERFHCCCKDGSYKAIEATASNLTRNPYIKGFLINFQDISDRIKKEEEILYLSYHDMMTGLFNRSFFDVEKSRLDTRRQLPISIIMGDVNGLKMTNDVYGHAEGDKLLVRVADILRQCCRQEEIIARIGGDEFCILLPQTSAVATQSVCKRIAAACDEFRNRMEGKTICPSIALGFATKTEENQSIDLVLKEAEDYMYRRKMMERTSTHSSIINSIRVTMHESSTDTEQHSERMTNLCGKVGEALDLTEEQRFELDLLARLHDIGKICIDEHILSKPGPLTEDEWKKVKQHPEVGFRIAQASPELSRISYMILCHHEHWDGFGYPRGLSGKNIPLLSRVIAVTDAYDAMTQGRPYRRAMSEAEAAQEIMRQAGKQFDPHIARLFVETVTGKTWES
jgi:diguanylate cyclase (GGDEF)-like protein/PAS domain S-box-containing protein